MRRHVRFSIALALAVATWGLAVGVVSARSGQAPDQKLLALYRTPAGKLPAVALRINGHVIGGQFLAYSIAALMQNSAAHGQPMTRAEATAEAVTRAVDRQLLLDEANRRGITVSDSELNAEMTAQVEGAKSFADQSPFLAAMAFNGNASYDEFAKDPKVRNELSERLRMSKLIAILRQEDPAFNLETVRSALRQGGRIETFVKVQLQWSSPGLVDRSR
jgi:hypothetical protein